MQSRKNAGNTYVHSYIGNGVGGHWFSENVTLANRVSGVRRWGREKWNRGAKGGGGLRGKMAPEWSHRQVQEEGP